MELESKNAQAAVSNLMKTIDMLLPACDGQELYRLSGQFAGLQAKAMTIIAEQAGIASPSPVAKQDDKHFGTVSVETCKAVLVHFGLNPGLRHRSQLEKAVKNGDVQLDEVQEFIKSLKENPSAPPATPKAPPAKK